MPEGRLQESSGEGTDELKPRSLVRAALDDWLLWIATATVALMAVVGFSYNITIGETDEVLFGGLAILLFGAGVARTAHRLRGA